MSFERDQGEARRLVGLLPAMQAVMLLVAAAATALAQPPLARQVPQRLSLHALERIDRYYWLKDRENPEVLEYLAAENAYTAERMRPLAPAVERLTQELRGRIQEADSDVPYFERGFWYYERTEANRQYPLVCRKQQTLEAPELVMLDGNELAKGQPYFEIGEWSVSPDGTKLAYTLDRVGFREYALNVKDLMTGQVIARDLVQAADLAWAGDNRTLFYVTENAAKRPYRLWRHRLGDPPDQDVLVYEETDETFNLSVGRSRDGQFLYRVSTSFTTTEQALLPSQQPEGTWRVISPRQPGHEYWADHRQGQLVILTNRQAPNFKLVQCPVEATDLSQWTDRLAHDPAVLLEEAEVFGTHTVLRTRLGGLPRIVVLPAEGGAPQEIEIAEPTYFAALAYQGDFDARTVRYLVSTPTTPRTDWEYDLDSGQRRMLKRQPVLGDFRREDYQSERIEATAPDGTRVPISLVYRRGTPRDGTAPCLLYAYGSYGSSTEASFQLHRLPLLNRGGIYARAHVRGGSELGRVWYDSGKMLNKQNTFGDFIACADHLVAEGYCARERLAIQGASAGGLLMGAVLNQRPDLCRAAILDVPFVDVLTTMSDPSLPLTAQEYEQWGNPLIREHFDYLHSYCPYTNLHQADYPAMLVTTALFDSQVLYHEPTKYVAKLRTLKTDDRPLLLRCQMHGGHGGSSGRFDALEEEAFRLAFLFSQLGIEP